jgi:N-acetylglucosaminyldiphosphoundecaprenol N-acetyl-beta-D-mannosaminyltransferase
MNSTYDVLGVPVAATDLSQTAALLRVWASDGVARIVTAPDVSNVVRSQDDVRLLEIHRSAAMVVPDGTPLVWLGLLKGHSVSRVCGPDLMDYVMREREAPLLRHYLYGGRPGVVEQLRDSFRRKYPSVQIVGAGTPPFRSLTTLELAAVAHSVNSSGADLVWIGISSPKQEYLMSELAPLVGATLIGVGAAFDFHSGRIRRAPVLMQRIGMEWFHRLVSEPSRLWRRYLVMAPRFLFLVLRSSFTRQQTNDHWYSSSERSSGGRKSGPE